MSSQSPWKGYIALLFGIFTVVFSLTLLTPCPPLILKTFGIPIELTAWVTLAYFIGATAFAPITGRLGDLYGRKQVVIVCTGIFVIGSIVTAISPTWPVFIIGRLIMGLGVSAIVPAGMAYVGEHFAPEVRGTALGVYGFLMVLGPIFGPSIGGTIADAYSWRACLWAITGLGIITLIAITAFMPKFKRLEESGKFDFSGALLILFTMTCLVSLPNFAASKGLSSGISLMLLAGLLIGGYLVVYTEKRVESPIIDVNFLLSRVFVVAVLFYFLCGSSLNANLYLASFFIMQVKAGGAQMAGFAIMCLFTGMAVGSISAGPISDRVRTKIILPCVAIIGGIGVSMLTSVKPATEIWYFMISLGVLGLALGVNQTAVMRFVIGAADSKKMGAASGTYSMLSSVAGPLGVSAYVAIFGVQTKLLSNAALVDQAKAAGAPANLIEALQRTGLNIDPDLGTKLAAAGIKVQELVKQASAIGMTSAIVKIAWIEIVCFVLALLLCILIPEKKKTVEQQAQVTVGEGK